MASIEDDALRIGQAAALLGVTVETLRRWEDEGRVTAVRSGGGQRLIPLDEVQRLLAERAATQQQPTIVASSARNQFEGVVTGVTADAAAAAVEVQAGPFRLVSLMTAESVRELGLQRGTRVVASVKSTNVVLGLPRM